MARPRKCRKVCGLPEVREFTPIASDRAECPEAVILTVDEYEAIRLIDNEGLSQEECGNFMQVARTTVQQIYERARKKVAHALVHGTALKIEGGTYRLCDGEESRCGGCRRRRHGRGRRLNSA
ncbi:MAG: DUF134 domain-containing protein [Fretibacterium sp.]|nr:DUF134 domain-containing protein [Fretibacterium sp.]